MTEEVGLSEGQTLIVEGSDPVKGPTLVIKFKFGGGVSVEVKTTPADRRVSRSTSWGVQKLEEWFGKRPRGSTKSPTIKKEAEDVESQIFGIDPDSDLHISFLKGELTPKKVAGFQNNNHNNSSHPGSVPETAGSTSFNKQELEEFLGRPLEPSEMKIFFPQNQELSEQK